MRRARGMSLIEVMVALAVLSFGLIAMGQAHMVGLASTAAGQQHTVAAGLARELLAGLERLPFQDGFVSTTGASGPTPPAPFGPLVDPYGALAAGAHEWSDATPVPGVRTDLAYEMNGVNAFQRRWTVWSVAPAAGGASSVKIIAVSVTWADKASVTTWGRGFPPRNREVIEYTFVANPGTMFQNIGANL